MSCLNLQLKICTDELIKLIRVNNLDKEHLVLKNKMVNSELKIGKIENDTSCLNLQLKIYTMN